MSVPMERGFSECLLISSYCSATCGHCPFRNGNVPARYMEAKDVLCYLLESSAAEVVLSGGEPFEHPEIHELVMNLQEVAPRLVPKIRFATGGHVDLEPFLEPLSACSSFSGISVGTDILSVKGEGGEARIQTWSKNIALLNQRQIPYSLTLTLGGCVSMPVAVVNSAYGMGACPEFVFVRQIQNARGMGELVTESRYLWPGTQILREFV